MEPQEKSPKRHTRLSAENIAKIEPGPDRFEVVDTEIPGFRLRVSPSGKMSYAIMYRTHAGKRVRFTIGSHGKFTPKQARDIAKTKLAEVALGGDPQADKCEARAEHSIPTLHQFANREYKEWVLANTRSGQDAVDRLNRVFCPQFGKTRLDQITAWNIEKWRAKRLKEGLAQTSVNRYLAQLRSALSKAVEWRIININPLAGVKGVKTDGNRTVRYLTDQEEKQLRAALRRNWRHKPDYLEPLVLMALNTGLRRGELFNLKWQHVNLTSALVTVEGKTAKNVTTRHVPLNREALALLRCWQKRNTDNTVLVFPGNDGVPMTTIKKPWATLLRQADIIGFRFHDTRHHFASKLVMKGVDLNTVRELLGHATIDMALRYAHLAPEHKAAAVARLVEVR